ncbi:MAG: sigma-54 dependent transcriptional regulator [Vicinamibacterales bacterium]
MSTPPLVPRLLVVDDDPGVQSLVDRVARRLGFEVELRTDGRNVLGALSSFMPDGAVVDLRLPGVNGLDVLRTIRSAAPGCQVILISGHGSIDAAVAALKAGALDFLSKPLDMQRFEELLVTVREGIRRRERFASHDLNVARQSEFHRMIGRAPAMQQLFDAIRRFAPHARTVLITGETGTGKELTARAFHQLGGRRDRAFIPVNCSAVVESLFESELFGHVKGAFTGAVAPRTGFFEAADGGTLFLDEIGDLPLTVQAKLLRAVEYGEFQRVGSVETLRVDVNLIAATHHDLRTQSEQGTFRSDLYYRLSTVGVHLPPLRARREDIPYMCAVFLGEFAERLGRSIAGITPAAEQLLLDGPWPGNIRELRSVLERACMLSEGRLLSERDVAAAWPAWTSADSPGPRPLASPPNGTPPVSFDDADTLDSVTAAQIARVLRDVGGNKTRAAKVLGVSRRSLYRWIDRLKLS